MHLVLRSSKARGEWSFIKSKNKSRILKIIKKHAAKNFIQVHSLAVVGNHIHLHIRLAHRLLYKPFIRAVTGAIALAVMGGGQPSRLGASCPADGLGQTISKSRRSGFWDYRPYSVIVSALRHFLNMKDYMRINQLEGLGHCRLSARLILAQEYDRRFSSA